MGAIRFCGPSDLSVWAPLQRDLRCRCRIFKWLALNSGSISLLGRGASEGRAHYSRERSVPYLDRAPPSNSSKIPLYLDRRSRFSPAAPSAPRGVHFISTAVSQIPQKYRPLAKTGGTTLGNPGGNIAKMPKFREKPSLKKCPQFKR